MLVLFFLMLFAFVVVLFSSCLLYFMERKLLASRNYLIMAAPCKKNRIETDFQAPITHTFFIIETSLTTSSPTQSIASIATTMSVSMSMKMKMKMQPEGLPPFFVIGFFREPAAVTGAVQLELG